MAIPVNHPRPTYDTTAFLAQDIFLLIRRIVVGQAGLMQVRLLMASLASGRDGYGRNNEIQVELSQQGEGGLRWIAVAVPAWKLVTGERPKLTQSTKLLPLAWSRLRLSTKYAILFSSVQRRRHPRGWWSLGESMDHALWGRAGQSRYVAGDSGTIPGAQ